MVQYKKCFKYFGIIALAVVITVMVSSFGATSQQTERWEYQVVCTTWGSLDSNVKNINNLGREGWEVLSVVHWPDSHLVFTLKRRVR